MNDSRKSGKKVDACGRSPCPVACTLDLLGDKWTLLVVRDLLLGKTTYTEFQQSPEKIPTNILAERLKRLQAAGVVVREKYQERPVRYRYLLSDKGKALYPVLSAMIDWGSHYVEGTLTREQVDAMITKGR